MLKLRYLFQKYVQRRKVEMSKFKSGDPVIVQWLNASQSSRKARIR